MGTVGREAERDEIAREEIGAEGASARECEALSTRSTIDRAAPSEEVSMTRPRR